MEQPIFQWNNPSRARGQLGHIFLWTIGNRPAAVAVATMFCFGWGGVQTQRKIVQELHALHPEQLTVERSVPGTLWQPKSGLSMKPLPTDQVPVSNPRLQERQAGLMLRAVSGYCVNT